MQQSTTRRTLHYYWQVTRKHKGLFWGLIVSTFLFVALLSYGNPYVMSLVVDRVSEGGVSPDEVFSAYGPYIVALIAINVFGQAASKFQDYTLYKLEIAAAYDLATMSFDALCNQSMSFHSNRFGGNACEPNVEIHERLPAAYRDYHVSVSAGYVLGHFHVRHFGAARAGVCGYSHGAARGVCHGFVHHVQTHSVA